MKRALVWLAGLMLLLAAGVLVFQQLWEPGADQRSVPVADSAAQIRQGAYLARAGNCMACHTSRGGPAYAGGRALDTPFGTMYGSNLTPDVATGIGSWSADDFWRAMHNGKSKDGHFLYPAFPYPNYTKVTRADSDALFAHLRTVAPVRQVNRAHALRFPYNQRFLLAFWRTLYFAPGVYQARPASGAQWNRGAYLAQGLGHCSACHAARGMLGGSLGAERLGGSAPGAAGWHAPALGGVADLDQLAQLLHSGVNETRVVAGPMAEVVAESLQYLSGSDVTAMAAYLVTLPGEAASAPVAAVALPEPVLRQGQAIYKAQCASCHGEQGEGVPRAYPPLAGRGQVDRGNAIRVVLNGGYAPGTGGNPRPYGMPPFSATLSDAEVAAVLGYIGSSWGNSGQAIATHEVGRLRSRE